MSPIISLTTFFFCFFFFSLSLLTISHGDGLHSLSDLDTLLKLKSSMLSPSKGGRGLDNWQHPTTINNNISPSFHCSFSGVTCNADFRVVSLNVSYTKLFGTLSPDISQLTELTNLTISGNNLTGRLPDELSALTSLTHLDLSDNNFTGELPLGLSSLTRLSLLNISFNNISGEFPWIVLKNMSSSLVSLDLYNNNFTGKLPVDEVVECKLLKHLNLAGNYFFGKIPGRFSELEELEYLALNGNSLSGELPGSLSRLKKLQFLFLGYFNAFSGGIPPEFGQLSSLLKLDMASCNLTGEIPKSLGNLKTMNTLFLQGNSLTGEIPPEISGCVSLMSLDLSVNSLTGEIPEVFSDLKNLTLLNLFANHLVGPIPSGIGDLPHLEVLALWNNNLTFELPANLGSSGRMWQVDVTSNHLTGPVPKLLCKGGKLRWLFLMDNAFLGPLPEELGQCRSLQRLRVSRNQLEGTIPPGILSLPNLQLVQLNDNQFSGELPLETSASMIGELDLSNNNLSGEIPPDFAKLTSLQKLSLQNNHFSGEIPAELFLLKQLHTVNISVNNLSGEIPASMVQCPSLVEVYLRNNSLTGDIPEQLGSLPSISTLDLSNNNFFGPKPTRGKFSVFKPSWFAGNPNLCWPNQNRPCPVYSSASRRKHTRLSSSKLVMLIIGVVTLVLLSIVTLIIRRRNRLEISKAWKIERFQRLDFRAEDVTECLKEENVIGKGGAGIVYRGTMPDGTDVAIKRVANRGLNDHGFSAEIATLGRIRHRNIVRLLGYVSNKETNLLVYEYMPNGSLGEKLHGPKGSHLQWEMRYKIAVEAAKGLCYLHHDCNPKIFHRDVKSNNILLDSDYEAHVADFGLAKFLREDAASECMSAIAGSYGYIAPEYAYTLQVDEKSDVYSFGVVLLELIAGRKPVGEFGEGVDIVRWVRKTQSEIAQPSDAASVLAILDSRLNVYQLSSVINMFKIAMLCVEDESSDRPTMREVVHMLTNPPPQSIISTPSLL